MNEKEIRYFSMFTGVGGFELGIERAYDSKSLSEIEQNGKGRNGTSEKPGTLLCPGSISPLCVGFSEINKYANQILKQKFPNTKNFGDCTKINPEELPDFDFLCGGFPCQSFSIAGKRKGFEDTRGTMFFEIARILKVKRPKTLLLENVKGLLNHNKGETFKVILQTLDELGYEIQWMVLNSKFFGVPQNRERVFIIGSLRGEPRPEILPLGAINKEDFKQSEKPSATITSRYYKQGNADPYISYARRDRSQQSRVYNQEGISPTLAGASKLSGDCTPKIVAMVNQVATKRTFETPKEINEFLRANRGLFTIKEIAIKLELPITKVEHYFRVDSSRAIPSPKVWKELKKLLCFRDDYDDEVTDVYTKEVEFEQTRRVYDDSIAPTINATQPSIHAVLTPDRIEKRQNGRRFKEDGEPSFTLTGQDVHGVSNGMKIRRLTPIECERLQGFPDNWTKGFSDTQRYKMMGNAVTVNVIEAIMGRLI